MTSMALLNEDTNSNLIYTCLSLIYNGENAKV